MSDSRPLTIQRLSTGSVFRIVAPGAFFSLVPFAVLMGVFALFGFKTVSWNQQPVLGVSGLLVSPLIGAFIAAVFTAFAGVALSFGLWLYSKWQPLRLQVYDEPARPPGA